MKFLINKNQIKAAAAFIAEKNKSIKQTAYAVESDILGGITQVLMSDDADSTTSIATAGWVIFFRKDECYPADYRVVEVLVDANVCGKYSQSMLTNEKPRIS